MHWRVTYLQNFNYGRYALLTFMYVNMYICESVCIFKARIIISTIYILFLFKSLVWLETYRIMLFCFILPSFAWWLIPICFILNPSETLIWCLNPLVVYSTVIKKNDENITNKTFSQFYKSPNRWETWYFVVH